MQLTDLIKPLEDMTDDELRAHLSKIRHNRTKAKPATVNREKREAKKGATGRISKVDDLFGGLSDEEKAELIKQLGG